MSRMGRFKDYGDCPVPKQPKHEPLYGDADESDRDVERDKLIQKELRAEQEYLKELRISRRQ